MEPIKLKELRNIHHMKQQELAEALNVSQQSISRYENGKHYPDLPALIEIADYFDVPLDYLVGARGLRVPFQSFTSIRRWHTSLRIRTHRSEMEKQALKLL